MRVTDFTVRAERGFDAPVTREDLDFLAEFERCTLPETLWTHLAHIRVAWTCLNLAPPQAALQRIRQGILQYNTKVLNRRNEYHETVTVAFVSIVADRMSANECWTDFAQRIDDLLDPDSPVLLRYYSEERLFSNDARLSFVGPDLKELPLLDASERSKGK